MEDNRAAALIMQAHVEKFIDFTSVDIYDPTWQKYCKLMLTKLDDLNGIKISEHRLNIELALLSHPNTDRAKAFELLQEEFEEIQANYKPWIGKSKEVRNRRKSKNYEELWTQVVGFDPKDRDAVRKWERHIHNKLQQTEDRYAREAKERIEQENRYKKVAEEVRNRRLQQGRRK